MWGTGLGRLIAKRHKETFWVDGDISSRDWDGGYISVYIPYHSLNCTLKMVHWLDIKKSSVKLIKNNIFKNSWKKTDN